MREFIIKIVLISYVINAILCMAPSSSHALRKITSMDENGIEEPIMQEKIERQNIINSQKSAGETIVRQTSSENRARLPLSKKQIQIEEDNKLDIKENSSFPIPILCLICLVGILILLSKCKKT